MKPSSSTVDAFQRDGFQVVRQVLSQDQVAALNAAVDDHYASNVTNEGKRGRSKRNVLAIPEVVSFARSQQAQKLLAPNLGSDAFVVRGILFDKVAEANWQVGWHQDQIIAVAHQQETLGFTAWSVKAGVVHVKPPASILENMATIRLHLDDCHQ